MNILIPMSGRGSRFEKAGFKNPKPLIDVNGKPMIQVVIENLNLDGHYIFLVLKDHYDKFNLKNLLGSIVNKSSVIVVDSVTEGAACTALLAKKLINNDDELIIANSDQWMDWNSSHFLSSLRRRKADGGIATFFATHPKWSFAKIDENNLVSEVAEKNPISTVATTGIYYFAKGKYFVDAAETMISKNIRTNNEFYICPSFNEMIKNGHKVYSYPIAEMQGLGTPEDLEIYLNKEY